MYSLEKSVSNIKKKFFFFPICPCMSMYHYKILQRRVDQCSVRQILKLLLSDEVALNGYLKQKLLSLIIDVGMKVLKKNLHNPRCNEIRKHNPRCNIIRKWLSVGRSVAYYVNIISPHFFFKVRIGTVPTPAILPSHIGYAPLDLPYNCRVALCRERDKRRPPR